MPRNRLLQFNTIPYPLWRRQWPGPLGGFVRRMSERYLAAEADLKPPANAYAMAEFMARYGLLGEERAGAARDAMRQHPATVEIVAQTGLEARPVENYMGKVRLPAQWSPQEAVILTWPVMYPPLWNQHAQMTEAITPVAGVQIIVPNALWATAIQHVLTRRGKAEMSRVRFLQLPTDDIWVRDYGPIMGRGANGEQVAVKAIFDPLPEYPQAQDNAMPLAWAAYEEVPVKHLNLHLEGGNVWSDGAGTLIVSEQVYYANPDLTAETLPDRLRMALDFDKLIVTPRLDREETGHVDLVIKLADARTVLLCGSNVAYNRPNIEAARRLFENTTNAAGERYRVIELPMPKLYLNWGVYPVWRSYTNALTVNGRVLVPVYGVVEDIEALATYRQAMPDYEIIPIDCSASINGGGGVHCLTKEVPGKMGD
ncbi:MAG: agmatine deiminase family protein [Anaerolineae bacterium]|nr:agmatine deiminase family protein [Anaerolineae bacterium]